MFMFMDLNTTICIGSILKFSDMSYLKNLFKYNNLYRFNFSKDLISITNLIYLNTTICIGSICYDSFVTFHLKI